MMSQNLNLITVLNKSYGHYKWRILVLIILGFLGGILEGIGVNALIPLFSLLVYQNQGSDFISKAIAGFFHYLPFHYGLTSLLVFIAILFIVRAAVLIFFSYIRTKTSVEYKINTMKDLLANVMYARWSYLLKQKLGYVQSTILRDVQLSGDMLVVLGQLILSVTGLIIYLLVAINISLYITLFTFISGLILLSSLWPLVKKTQKISEETTKIEKLSSQHLSEHIMGIKTVKTMASEQKVIEEGTMFFDILKNFNIKTALLRSVGTSSLSPLSVIFIAIIFSVSYQSKGFNLVAFAAIIYLIQKIFVYIEGTQGAFHSLGEFVPHAVNVINFRETLMNSFEENLGSRNFKFSNNIIFQDIVFSYDNGNKVLDGVNFKIEKGKTFGLIGYSGAGKTSIADLLLGLFTPQKGKILLDGINIKEINIQEWRKKVGYVSQDIFLLNDTIRNNIVFYNSIKDEEIMQVAKVANIDKFINSLPDGLDTIVGDNGVMLSGGQRQRIVLARVLARHPDILILDEATSALDNESEALISEAIRSLKGQITVFIIAHRLSTVMNVDCIGVLNKGKIVEEGRPHDLLKYKNSYFYKMYTVSDILET